MNIAAYLVAHTPELRTQLYKARMPTTPEAFIKKSIRNSLMMAFMVGACFFLFTKGMNYPLWMPIAAAFFGGYGTYWYSIRAPQLKAQEVAIDIDREVLFAGRFLLVKLNSGKPLVNALFEASKSYGVSSKYFLEIVRDIELGTPMEEAIEKAMVNSPSDHWRKILFQIHNALKLGIDVTNSLESVLEDISYDYLLKIQRYGKKLGTVTLFYLLLGVVFPSLGMTIITVLIGFTNIQLSTGFFVIVLVLVAFIQIIFMRVFNSIRPKVNL